MTFLYIIVAFLATIIGSLTGLGGGIIIKPVMDMISNFPVDTIGIISSITVFSMSLVSIVKYYMKGKKLPMQIVTPIAIGSVLGGIIGQFFLDQINQVMALNHVKVIQNSVLAVIIIGSFLYMHFKPVLGNKPKHIFILSIVVGMGLGFLSSMLGIGGGPFNIVAFLFIFTFDIRLASIASLASILFSQSAKLLTIAFTSGFQGYDLHIVPYMVFAAIFGAQTGSRLQKYMTAQRVEVLFLIMLWVIFFISLYNIFMVGVYGNI